MPGIVTTNLETELRAHLGDLSTQELSSADALLLLNRAYWELLDKIHFREKEASSDEVTVAGQEDYDVPDPFEAVQLITIEDPDSHVWTPLNRLGDYAFELDKDDGSVAAEDYLRGTPVSYMRYGSKIKLRPMPDKVYNFKIKYWTTLDNLTNSVNLSLPPSWHEVVLYGAVHRGYLRLRDFEAASEFKVMQDNLLASSQPVVAKEERDSHVVGLQAMGRSYD